jgi:hypothetical protein
MAASSQLTESQMQVIQAQLQSGELLCWTGSAPRHRSLHRLRITLLAACTGLMVLLTGMLLLLNPGFLRRSISAALPVLLLTCLAALGGLLLASELYFSGKREPSVYAITNRRALVITQPSPGKVSAYGMEILQAVKIRQRRDGSGDILFEYAARWEADELGRLRRQTQPVGFFGLPDVQAVYRLLQNIGKPLLINESRSSC